MHSPLLQLSSGFLTAILAVILPISSTAASALPQLEAEPPHVHARIEEWYWRDMSL